MAASGIVFAFEGPYEVIVSNSLRDAEAQFEPHYFEPTEYVIIVDDGTIVDAAVENGVVVLTPSATMRPDELRDRLRTFLSQPRVGLEVALADDPPLAGREFLARQRANWWPRRPRWLHRLVHRD